MYHEVYKRKAGTAAATPDGNTIDYFINGVPTPEKDYLLSVSTLAEPEQLKNTYHTGILSVRAAVGTAQKHLAFNVR